MGHFPAVAVTVTSLLIYISFFVSEVAAVDRKKCAVSIGAGLKNGTIRPDSDIFHRDGQRIMSDPDNIGLTLEGCWSHCGTGYDWYTDIGPRLTTWLIPVLVLLGNTAFSRLGKVHYLTVIVHLIGDPIDSMWSLLTKAEAWSRCYSLAKQNMVGEPEYLIRDRATILAAIEELDGPEADVKAIFDEIIRASNSQLSKSTVDHICNETASELADSRTNELLRASLAVLSYLYTVIGGFVEAVGGESTSQPGGRIGTAMFLSWLIPFILLSNAVGGFASRRTCLRIMERFTRTICGAGHMDLQVFSKNRHSVGFRRFKETRFHEAQPWSGSIYTYRPEKRIFPGGPRDQSPWLLLFIAILPVCFATAAGFAIIWYTPTVGFGCRQMPIVTICAAWFVSVFVTWILWRTRWAIGQYHWYITLAKDAVIALATILMVVLSSSGLFNSCWCWSAPYSRGTMGFILLAPEEERRVNARTIYPGLVGACLGLQFVVFGWMMFVGRHGSDLLRRSEGIREEDFERTHNAKKASVAQGAMAEVNNSGPISLLSTEMSPRHSSAHSPRSSVRGRSPPT